MFCRSLWWARTPSLTRKPAARAKSSPGVRMVMARGLPLRRISSGSSVTRVSGREEIAPSRMRITLRRSVTRPICVSVPVLYVLVAETALAAEAALGHRGLVRGGDLHDPIVLHMERASPQVPAARLSKSDYGDPGAEAATRAARETGRFDRSSRPGYRSSHTVDAPPFQPACLFLPSGIMSPPVAPPGWSRWLVPPAAL